MIFTGLEKFGFVLLFCTPDEFYVKLVTSNESIKLLKVIKKDKVPNKNEISAGSKFLIEHNSEYVLCEILDDLKYDEIFCQVLLCNSNIKLKVDYRKLLYLNSDDILNDESCISLKFCDFSPIYPNHWNSDLILKLKKLITFNKFIFQFKSFKVDPIDGRYSVEVLRVADRKSINEKFLDEKLAIRSFEYFKEKVENEATQIFYAKKEKDIHYKISVPLAKNKPKLRSKTIPVKSLNVSAQPFIPTRGQDTINNSMCETPQSNSNAIFGKKFVTPISSVNSNPVGLQSNIVNMFSEMYRNRQCKINNKSTVPFSNYQSIFPSYGGVNFSNISTLSTLNSMSNKQNLSKIKQSSSVEISENSNTNFAHQQNVLETSTNLSMNCYSVPFSTKEEMIGSSVTNDSPLNVQFINSKISNEMSNCQSASLNEGFNFENQNILIDVSSIPLPPTTLQTSELSSSNIQVFSYENLPYNADSIVSSLSSLAIQQPLSTSNSVAEIKSTQSNSYTSSPVDSNPIFWPQNMSTGDASPSFGNVNYIFKAPMPNIEYMRRFPVPSNYLPYTSSVQYNPIHRDNLYTFHPNYRPEPFNFFNNNILKTIPIKEPKVGESIQLKSDEKLVDTPFPNGMWIQAPPHFVPSPPQTGSYHVQPINLIYYQPNR